MQGSPQDILYPWVWIIQIFLQVQNTVSISLHLQLLHLFPALMIFRAEPNVQIKTNVGLVYK